MIVRYQWEVTVWYIVAMLVIATLVYYFVQMAWIINVHGDDTEDKGTTLNERLLERAREWNINKAMNDTLALAERFNAQHEYYFCVFDETSLEYCMTEDGSISCSRNMTACRALLREIE